MRTPWFIVKTYFGADVNSDHNSIVIEFRLKLKEQRTRKINIEKLNSNDVKTHVGSKLEIKMKEIKRNEQTDIETTWNKEQNNRHSRLWHYIGF